jgi:hypothetical protein
LYSDCFLQEKKGAAVAMESNNRISENFIEII